MRRRLFLLLLVLVLVACRSSDDKEEDSTPPNPSTLIADAAKGINEAETFRLEIRYEGPPTTVETDLLGDAIHFNNAQAFYAAPDRIQAKVSVSIGEVTQDVLVVAVQDRQYLNNAILTQGNWQRQDFARGFRAEDVTSAENGIGTALLAMENLEYIGREEISGGIQVYHLKGTVAAQKVRSVTVGLMASEEGTIETDIYIRRDDTHRLARIVLKEPVPTDNETAEVTKIWIIDFDSYNQVLEITEPEASS